MKKTGLSKKYFSDIAFVHLSRMGLPKDSALSVLQDYQKNAFIYDRTERYSLTGGMKPDLLAKNGDGKHAYNLWLYEGDDAARKCIIRALQSLELSNDLQFN